MKHLMMSTAIMIATGTMAFADAHTMGFLDSTATVGAMPASDLIGMRAYATEVGADATMNMTADAEQEWDDIGEINEIMITSEGNVAAVVIGVGGFLGLGDQVQRSGPD